MSSCEEKFFEAAQRHWLDAEILFERGRFANADQLYGLAAECVLKAIWEPHVNGIKNFRVHMDENKLIKNIITFFNLRTHISLLNLIPEDSPYDDWAITQRYCSESIITLIRVQSHREWTRKCFELFRNANLDGLL
ncbi:MAG: hypothetical protein HQL75_14365 [Magnetococcales bacterium]|nr:hypothetical protein [Magnetococcales bacterium]